MPALLALLVASCFSSPAEAPVLLSTVSTGRGITVDREGSLVIATDDAILSLDAKGRQRERRARAVIALAAGGSGELLVATEEAVLRLDAPDGPTRLDGTARAVAVGCGSARYLAREEGVLRWDVSTGALEPFGGPGGVHHLRFFDCEALLAWDDARIWHLEAGGRSELARPTPPVHAVAARDRDVFVAHGDPPRLSRVEEGGLQPIAPLSDPPRAMHFGAGTDLPTVHLYLATEAGLQVLKVD